MTPTFQTGDVRDYTVTVYAPIKVTVTDNNSRTNEVGEHDKVGITPAKTAEVVVANAFTFTGDLD